jgi:DNA-binding GntR family transcriptional regulator
MIVDGELRAGEIVPERILCETFGVSRTPLREAFKILASEGLIELRPHRTPLIAPINRNEIANMFDVMVALDAVAGAQAAALATEQDFARLDEMHDQLVQLHRDASRAAYFRLNQTIHIEITRLARNPVLLNVWTTLHANIFRARALANYDVRRWDESVKEHDAFMELFRARDAAGFAVALSVHTRRTGDAVLLTLE